MKTQPTLLLLTVVSLLAAAAAAASVDSLKIHLPRAVTIEGATPTLGQIAILRGSETLTSLAGDIALGRLATPDQNILVSKHMILSRLATNGVVASRVAFTGAEETVVTRRHERVTEDRLVKEAAAFLKNNLPNPSICQIEVIRTPGDMVLSGEGENIQLVCRLLNAGARNQSKVLVAAFDDGKEVARREVYFRFRYQARRVVTQTALNKGDLISTGNIAIETAVSDFPEPVGWIAPYGLVAARSVPANTVLTDAMVSTPQPQVVIKRNQSVPIKLENAGLVATAIGKALQDGVSGEYIKVQNTDSKVIIMARVNDDGTVEPVY